MSKKSYKQLQNRLYREIKRRIITEQRLLRPVSIVKREKKIEKLKVRNMVPEYMEQTKEYIEFIKHDIAKQIMQKLIDDGYVQFKYFGKYQRVADDEEVMDVKEIEAILNVVRPWHEWGDELSEPQSAT